MTPVVWDDVSFDYDGDSVFQEKSLTVPHGVTSLTGPNGAGKSTFLLLSSARILPSKGTVTLFGRATVDLNDDEKNRLCSLVYQNMEFETEEPLGALLSFVAENGYLGSDADRWRDQIIRVFELDHLVARPTQALSKGEMQRAVMAFALLYGSRLVAMDEPVFALEPAQKTRALGFISEFARDQGISFVYSVHELDLTRSYSDHVLLFSKEGEIISGTAEQVLRPEVLERAYEYPYALLHQKEQLHRETLLRIPSERELWESGAGPKN